MEWMPSATFLGPLTLTALVSYSLTGLARKVAPYLGLIDKPDGGRKKHKKATPVMGGVAFITAILLVVSLAVVTNQDWLADEAARQMTFSLGISMVCFCLLGVCDDRWPLSPRVKLIGQILASLPFVAFYGAVQKIGFLSWEIPLGPVGGPITILWLVACSNVVNLIDGLDGLAGSIGLVVMITIAALFEIRQDHAEAVLTLVIAGGLIGFLCHNWPPAKIFMGDAGSMTIGFLAGALSMQASSKTTTTCTLAVPLVLMSIPLFDTVMAILRRRLTGRSIGEGDRGHIHHRLQERGLTRQQSLLAITGLTLIMAGAALLSVKFQSETVGVTICASVLGLLILGRVFGYHETSLVFRHLQELGDLLVDTSGVLRTRLLLARLDSLEPQQRTHLWDELVKCVAEMKATRLEYSCRSVDQDEQTARLRWDNTDPDLETGNAAWKVVYQVPRADGLMATWEAHGTLSEGQDTPLVDELFRLFTKVGAALPTENLRPISEAAHDEASTLSFPQPNSTESTRRAA